MKDKDRDTNSERGGGEIRDRNGKIVRYNIKAQRVRIRTRESERKEDQQIEQPDEMHE